MSSTARTRTSQRPATSGAPPAAALRARNAAIGLLTAALIAALGTLAAITTHHPSQTHPSQAHPVPDAGPFTNVGHTHTIHVTPGQPFTIDLPGVATIHAPAGSVTHPGTITAQAVHGTAAANAAVHYAGTGLHLTFHHTALTRDVSATFHHTHPDTRNGYIPAVLHHPDPTEPHSRPLAGDIPDVRPGHLDQHGNLTFHTREFSTVIPISLDVIGWATDTFNAIRDNVIHAVNGRTDPIDCPTNAGPPWASLQVPPDMVHNCLITNADPNGTPRAEVQLKSNRANAIFVRVPDGAAYAWSENSPWLRTALAHVDSEDPDHFIVLTGGQTMTAGYYRPLTDTTATFTVGIDGLTRIVDLYSTLLDVLGAQPIDIIPTTITLAHDCSDFVSDFTPDGALACLWSITKEGFGNLANPVTAAAAAENLLGPDGAVYATRGLDATIGRLQLLGHAFELMDTIPALGALLRNATNNVLDTFAELIAPTSNDDTLWLNADTIHIPAPATPLPTLTNPTLTITGTCTTTNGTLTGTAAGLTPNSTATYAAWYPDGTPYTNLTTTAHTGPDGTAPWTWPCTGDPAGTYTTQVIDNATGTTTPPTPFTIGNDTTSPTTPDPGSGTGSGSGSVTLTVSNQVTNGPTQMRDDDTPAYLSTTPTTSCKAKGCALPNTDLTTGNQITATCTTQGDPTTNGDNRPDHPEDDNNPQRYTSTLYYGITWPDGRFGYISEVWIANRGTHDLPAC